MINSSQIIKKISSLVFFCLLSISSVQAAMVTYNLEDIKLTDTLQITGSFDWTYADGKFDKGSGMFTTLDIFGYNEAVFGPLEIIINIEESIEFALVTSLHDKDFEILLSFDQALTPTTSTDLDLDKSIYTVVPGLGEKVRFIDGSIKVAPSAVPVPAAAWLFGSGLLGLFGFSRKNKA